MSASLAKLTVSIDMMSSCWLTTSGKIKSRTVMHEALDWTYSA